MPADMGSWWGSEIGWISLEGQTSALRVMQQHECPNYLTITHKIIGCLLLCTCSYLLRQPCLAQEVTGDLSPRFCFWRNLSIFSSMCDLTYFFFFNFSFFPSDLFLCKRVWNTHLAVSLTKEREAWPWCSGGLYPQGTAKEVIPILQRGVCWQREHEMRQGFQTGLLAQFLYLTASPSPFLLLLLLSLCALVTGSAQSHTFVGCC